MVVLVCLHITLPRCHHYADAFDGIGHSAECVSDIKPVNFHAIYGAVCIQLAHLSYDDCKNACVLSYYHHQIGGSRTHLPFFRVRS